MFYLLSPSTHPESASSWTGQLPPLLQAAGWEKASPAGSVQVSCPLIGHKGQAWQGTNEEAVQMSCPPIALMARALGVINAKACHVCPGVGIEQPQPGLSEQKLYNRAHWARKGGQIVQRPLGRQKGTLHCPVATLHHLMCHKCVAKYDPQAPAAATVCEPWNHSQEGFKRPNPTLGYPWPVGIEKPLRRT